MAIQVINTDTGMTPYYSHPVTTNKLADEQIQRLEGLVHNVLSSRADFFRQFMDPRRSIEDECGFPRPGAASVDLGMYLNLYDREAVAARVVEVLPKETWRVTPNVTEDNDPKKKTPFEEAWEALGSTLGGEKSWNKQDKGSIIWEYLRRVDEQSGIGRFGVLLIGIDDGKTLDQPADGVVVQTPGFFQSAFSGTAGTDAQYFGTQLSPPEVEAKSPSKKRHNLTFLRVFREPFLVQIVEYEADASNPRFSQPKMYLITLNDPREAHSGVGLPTAQVRVHWTRVIHVADNLSSSEIFGVPRQQQVLNHILSLCKVYGASGEGYWKSCFTGLALETHPQLGGDVEIDRQGLRDMMEQYQNSLQKYLVLSGMSAKSLAPSVVDPTPHIAIQIEAICIKLGVPVRIFKGSERGELASTQDDEAWVSRLRSRQSEYVTSRIVVPFINRLISLGVLPQPKFYNVNWPEMDSLTDSDKANIATNVTTALARYVRNSVWLIMTPLDYLIEVCRFDQETAVRVLENLKTFFSDTSDPIFKKLQSILDMEKVGVGNKSTSAPAKYTNDSGKVGTNARQTRQTHNGTFAADDSDLEGLDTDDIDLNLP